MELTGNFTVTVSPKAGGGGPALLMEPLGGNLQGENQGAAVGGDGDFVCKISGGTPPYDLSVVSGSLPPGMSLGKIPNDDGTVTVTLAGTPTQSGAFSFGLLAKDAQGLTARLG